MNFGEDHGIIMSVDPNAAQIRQIINTFERIRFKLNEIQSQKAISIYIINTSKFIYIYINKIKEEGAGEHISSWIESLFPFLSLLPLKAIIKNLPKFIFPSVFFLSQLTAAVSNEMGDMSGRERK